MAVSAASHGVLFGFNVISGNVSARQGVRDDMELGVDLSLMSVDDSNAALEQDTWIWSGRIGGKWAPESLNNVAAITYGFGGGTSTGGDFVSPDLGVVASWNNERIVPFMGLSGFVSQPFNTNPVDISSESQGAGTHVMEASTAWGFNLFMGLEVPIEISGITLSPRAGMTWGRIMDSEEGTNVAGAQVGLAINLP